jgi:cytochrome c-type biogenesis protein CcmE
MTDTDAREARPPVVPVPQRHHKRYIVLAVVCAVIVVWMLTVLQKSAVYLRTVSYSVDHRVSLGDRTFRMAGTVVPGTIRDTAKGAAFELAEGGSIAKVDYSGGPRDLFTDCAPAVVNGHWQGTTFVADQLLIRHGSEYDPKQHADANCNADASS